MVAEIRKTLIYAHTNGVREGRFFYLRLSVCLSVFRTTSIKDAARTTKLDVEMFHDEPWKHV